MNYCTFELHVPHMCVDVAEELEEGWRACGGKPNISNRIPYYRRNGVLRIIPKFTYKMSDNHKLNLNLILSKIFDVAQDDR